MQINFGNYKLIKRLKIMSRTKRGSKCLDYEWWSRRPYSGYHEPRRASRKVNRLFKRFLGKAERRQGKQEIVDQIKQDYEISKNDEPYYMTQAEMENVNYEPPSPFGT